MISIAWVASGRPAPRYASVGTQFVKTPVISASTFWNSIEAGNHEDGERRDQRREQLMIGAEVLQDVNLQAENCSVAFGRDFNDDRRGHGRGS